MKLLQLTEIVTKHETLKNEAKSNYENIVKEKEFAQDYSITIMSVKSLFETLLNKSRKDIKENISNIITLALREILGINNIEFGVDFEFKRNQPEAYLYVEIEGFKTYDLEDSYGGGIEDVVGSVLKLVYAQLLNIQGPFLLDEPGKWIDAKTSVAYAQFLKQLNKKFDKQMFLITQKDEISEVADSLISVFHDQQRSVVKVE